MIDPWIDLLALCDYEPRVIAAEWTDRWPVGSVPALEELGFLQPTEPLDALACPECPDAPFRDVRWVDHLVTGEPTAYLCCPECGASKILPDILRCWSIAWSAIVERVAQLLDIRGPVEALIPDRLWRLGKAHWSGRPTTVFCGRALHRRDAEAALAIVERSTSAVVLVPKCLPQAPFKNPVLPLSLVCHWDGTGLITDREYVTAQALPKLAEPTPRPAPRMGRRAVIEQRLQAELEAHLAAVGRQIRTALDFGREPSVLPCPSRKELARRCDTSEATVSRCFADGAQLQRLWDTLQDPLALLAQVER